MHFTKTDLNQLTYEINGAAIEVHKALGPGLLESVYHTCMKHELDIRGIHFLSEPAIPVIYKEQKIDTNLRCDLLVKDQIVVELKSVSDIAPIHAAQLLTYMKLLNIPKGILYNFNCVNLYREGQWTYVNESFAKMRN